jgi:hypothetical protein
MYCAHSARVIGLPAIEHTYAAAASAVAGQSLVVSSWLPAAIEAPSELNATEKSARRPATTSAAGACKPEMKPSRSGSSKTVKISSSWSMMTT